MGLHHRLPGRALTALALAAALAGAAAAADAVRQERIQFDAGATEAKVEGAISGYDSVEYQVAASTGQVMKIGLQSDNLSAYFNVYRPGDLPGESTALHIGPRDGNAWSATLRKSGDYTVQVFLIRAAARRSETASYELSVSITGAAAEPAAAVPPEAMPAPAEDFADGLAGGPDFWKVSGLGEGEVLKLRAAPSTSAEVLASFPTGTLLRNKGCRMTGTQRWCAVEDEAARAGWVSGRYLSEATDGPTAGN